MAAGDRFQYGSVGTSAVTVTLGAGTRRVRVINMDGAGIIYASANGDTPTVSGNFRAIPAGVGSYRDFDVERGAAQDETAIPVVKLIASATTAYGVEVV